MTKEELLIEFMVLISAMQNIAVDLVDTKEYTEIGEFLDDIFINLDTEEIVAPAMKNSGVFGTIDKQKAMIDIGDNQGLMIFGEENDYED